MKRFEDKVDRSGSCHLWTAGCNKNGYGNFWFEGKTVSAHIMAWLLKHGSWPSDCLLHICDQRNCVNIDHLREGTHKENTQDMWDKGRQGHRASGEEHPMVKISKHDADKIRAEYILCRISQSQLGQRYNISQQQVWRIVNGLRWK